MDSENVVISWGKFDGCRVTDLETSELGWLKRYGRLTDAEWFAIRAELSRRRELRRRKLAPRQSPFLMAFQRAA